MNCDRSSTSINQPRRHRVERSVPPPPPGNGPNDYTTQATADASRAAAAAREHPHVGRRRRGGAPPEQSRRWSDRIRSWSSSAPPRPRLLLSTPGSRGADGRFRRRRPHADDRCGDLAGRAAVVGRAIGMPRQGPWRLPAAYARSDRLTRGAESPPVEPKIHSEHNRQERSPDHALPHPHQGAVSRNRSMRGIAQVGSAACPTVRRRERNHARGAGPARSA